MKDYIFIVKKYDIDCGDIIRKALYFKDIDSYLNDGWNFNTPSDKTIYQALYNFYMVMNNDKD